MPKFAVWTEHPSMDRLYWETTAASPEDALTNMIFANLGHFGLDKYKPEIARGQALRFINELKNNDWWNAVDINEVRGAISAIKAAMDVSDTGDLSRHDPMNNRWPQLQPSEHRGPIPQHPEFANEDLVNDPNYQGGENMGADSSGYKLN